MSASRTAPAFDTIGIGFTTRSASTGLPDASHLEWMRDHLGQRFLAGIVFHTGPSAFTLAEQITALPIAALRSVANAV